MKIWGHRGASAYAPENTLAAFHLAHLMGADGVECDAQFTKDKQVVLIHDSNLFRTSGVDAMSCHLVVTNMADAPKTLVSAKAAMEATFDITHTTIQIEDQDLRKAERELKY